MASRAITVNRAPVLTLWASVVAERLGFDRVEALSLAQAVARLNAQSKGRRLGIFKPQEEKPQTARKKEPSAEIRTELLGRSVPVRNTKDGIRAVQGVQVIEPDSVRRYLESKFGDDLDSVRSAMVRLAKSYKPEELAERAYRLYEHFRPEIPEGVKGWGAKGNLDLKAIEELAKKKA